MSQRESFIFFCFGVLSFGCWVCWWDGDEGEREGVPFVADANDGGDDEEEDRGPTETIREPNSTPMVTSWEGEKRPSQRRMVREDLPVPLSPMQTSLAM